MHAGRRPGTTDAGYTLLELTVTMLIMGLLGAFSVTGWVSYQRSLEGKNASAEVMAVLRNAQERSLAEASTYCVAFDNDGRTYRMYKFSCTGGTAIGSPLKTPSARVTVSAAAFTQSDGSVSRELRFYPRGAATPGSVTLSRAGSNHSYRINVEGLTGRVSLNG